MSLSLKAVLLAVAAASLFASGYWAGSLRTRDHNAADRTSPGLVPAGKGGIPETAAADSPHRNAGGVRSFTSGRPFLKGQAKAWLLSIGAGLKNKRDLELKTGGLLQDFLTMDETCAVETISALDELSALFEVNDPSVRGLNDHGSLRKTAMMIAMFRLAQLNPAAGLERLKTVRSRVPGEAVQFTLAQAVSQNPSAAGQLLAGIRVHDRSEALSGILHAVAASDPAAALDLLETYAHEVRRDDRNLLLDRLMARDPRKAAVVALRMAEKSDDHTELSHVLNSWAKLDHDAAFHWATSPAGGAPAVQAWLIRMKALSDPATAAVEFQTLAATGRQEELSATASYLAGHFARKDVTATKDWMESLPEGRVRGSALRALARHWVSQDAPGASEWIRTLPPGDDRDDAAAELVVAIARRNPQDAFQWAVSIGHASRRAECLERVFFEWRLLDPEAAGAAMKTVPAENR